jgi:hypothetical protein
MKWNAATEELYQRIVDNVPPSKKVFVEAPLRRGAEARASDGGAELVTDSAVILGFFDVTPEAFHSQVIANLEDLGIDYEKFLGSSSPAAGKRDFAHFLADLKAMSAIAEVPFDEARTRAVIKAYAEFFETAPVAMRTTTKPKERRDLSVRYLDMQRKHEPDPLVTALAESFYEEAKDACGAFGFGVDLNVRSGFSKIWMAPDVGCATLDAVMGLPSLPPAAKKIQGHFAKYGLDVFGLFGFDFVHRTTNLYFMIKHPEAPRDYAELLADVSFTPDLPEALEACRPAHVLYYSFSWDADTVQRVCFAVVCEDKSQVPVHFDPLIGKCVAEPAFMKGGERCIYSVVWAPRGHYFKIDNDYSGTMAADLVAAGVVGV